METSYEVAFYRWYDNLVARKARLEAEILSEDITKKALREAYDLGFQRGYDLCLRESHII